MNNSYCSTILQHVEGVQESDVDVHEERSAVSKEIDDVKKDLLQQKKRKAQEAEELHRKRQCVEKEAAELAAGQQTLAAGQTALQQAKNDFSKEKEAAWADIRETVKMLKGCVEVTKSRWVWKAAGTIVSCLLLIAAAPDYPLCQGV